MNRWQREPEGWEKLRTVLPDGKIVSTVHLGLNHGYGDGPDLWFETMVFPGPEDWNDLDSNRYTTADEAREGHAEMVAKWTAEVQP